MQINMQIRYVLLASANHHKPTIVLDLLCTDDFFTKDNTIIFTDSPYGKLVSLAKENKIKCYSFSSIREIEQELLKIRPHYLISCGWHSILPKAIIEIPLKASLNCHGSFLPDYKGASPFKHYWSNWEEYGGASIHLITEKIDEGRVIIKEKFRIKHPTTPNAILKQTSVLTARILKLAIIKFEEGFKGEMQSGGRYFFKIPNHRHLIYWIYNFWAFVFNLKKISTPYKSVR